MATVDEDDSGTNAYVNPTSVTDVYWVWTNPPPHLSTEETLGKWLVFRDLSRLDSTWHEIRQAVESGELGATGAKSSTAIDRPEKKGVICVYTTKEDMDAVGMRLVRMVKHEIRYKTDAATLAGLYTCRGHGKVTCRTIYWNDGEPSFEKMAVDEDDNGTHAYVNPTSVTDVYWVWANPPPHSSTEETLGKWLVFRDLSRLDSTWHEIRQAVESGELGATGAKSSTAIDCSKKQGVICVYTTKEEMDAVGMRLVRMVKHEIRYKTDAATLAGLYTSQGHGKVTCRTIYWNDGEPSFEKMAPARWAHSPSKQRPASPQKWRYPGTYM